VLSLIPVIPVFYGHTFSDALLHTELCIKDTIIIFRIFKAEYMKITFTNKLPISFVSDKILARVIHGVLAFLGAVLVLKAASTFRWRMELDTPLLHYAAFLMDKYHAVPYRDFFETSMPGTFAFHYSIVKLFGYSDLAFRCVDLALLSLLLSATYLFMSRFGKISAFWASIVFGLIYLSFGQTMSLQRDYIGTILVALTLICIPRQTSTTVRMWRFALVGFLFGAAALIKPHLAITLPVISGALLMIRWKTVQRTIGDFARCITILALSFAFPIMIAVVWLAAHSALIPFINIFFDYLPLHSSLTGEQQSLSSSDHIVYLILKTLSLGYYTFLFLCSLFALHQAWIHVYNNGLDRIWLICLLFCTILYALYPALAGKFWDYHYMPFAYFCSISTGTYFAAERRHNTVQEAWQLKKLLVLIIFLLVLIIQVRSAPFLSSLVHDLEGAESHAPRNGRVDEIATWLQTRLHPGDTVQPLDWTGGSIHAMLLAQAKLSTTFMYDYHFYHNVSSPYIQGLRSEFIRQLFRTPPRFIIEVQTDKPWVSGIDTTRAFPELHAFMNRYYAVACEGKGYVIYERTSSIGSQ
jgi:hypothetical protein